MRDLDVGRPLGIQVDHTRQARCIRVGNSISAMPLEILDRRSKDMRLILELAQSPVAVEAQQSADLPGDVIVVNVCG